MNCLVYIVIIYLLLESYSYAETCDPNARPKTDSQRIKEQLLCNHDKNAHPGLSTQNRTNISLFISPITIEYVEQSASINLQTWIELFWKNDKFAWNEQDYNNTTLIMIEADKVWIPDLTLINWREATVQVDQVCSHVMVGKEGWLYTSTIPVLRGHCVPDYSKWPFDIQNCEITLQSRQYYGHEVDFILSEYGNINKGLYMEDFVPSREWQLLDHRAERIITNFANDSDTETYYEVEIQIFFSIKRHASVLISSYVMPAFVMVLLSLTVLWFNPLKYQRIPIICVLILLQSLFLQYFAYKIPSNGTNIPGIVIFYGASFILTILLLLLTMLTRSMQSWISKPYWLSAILNIFRTNRVFQLILITDLGTYTTFEEDRNEESFIQNYKTKGEKEWQELALAINRVTFVVLIPIYFILFLHFIV